MRFDLKPAGERRISLFANWGEAIVFWLSLSGLVLLGLITLLKWVDRHQTRAAVEAYSRELVVLAGRMDTLASANDQLQRDNDAIRQEYETLRAAYREPAPAPPSLRSEDESATPGAASDSREAGDDEDLTEEERNRRRFLQVSNEP